MLLLFIKMNRRRLGVNYIVIEVETPISIPELELKLEFCFFKVIGISENIICIFNYFSII